MNRTMVGTVIRGQGEGVDVVFNGLVNQEIVELQESHKAEIAAMERRHQKEMATLRAQLEATENHRNRLLKEKLDKLRVPKRSVWQRFLDWGEWAGLWEKIEEV